MSLTAPAPAGKTTAPFVSSAAVANAAIAAIATNQRSGGKYVGHGESPWNSERQRAERPAVSLHALGGRRQHATHARAGPSPGTARTRRARPRRPVQSGGS